MSRSADGRGDLKGAMGLPCSLGLKGALWVSLMMRILVLMVGFDIAGGFNMCVVVGRVAEMAGSLIVARDDCCTSNTRSVVVELMDGASVGLLERGGLHWRRKTWGWSTMYLITS